MARVSNPFRYLFKEVYPSQSAIYKAWFGKKYLIWKGKALHQSVNGISTEIDQRLRLGTKENDQFEKVCNYIRSARVTIFEVEAVLLSDNPAELLIEEHKLLKAGENDPQCLNVTFFPMFPKWIPETAVNEFQQHLAKIKAQSQKQPKKKTSKKKAVSPSKRKKPVKSKIRQATAKKK